MVYVTPKYQLRVPAPSTRLRDLGAELLDMGVRIEEVLSSFDYNGADPGLVAARVVALESLVTAARADIQTINSNRRNYAGTPAQRALLTPLPAGATWQDTDTARRLWKEQSGAWVLWETPWTSAGMTPVTTEPTVRHRIVDGMVEIVGVCGKPGATYGLFTLLAGRRPSRLVKYSDASEPTKQIQISAAGAVSYTDLNAATVNFGSIRYAPAS